MKRLTGLQAAMVCVTALCAATSEAAQEIRNLGPIPIYNQGPIQLMFLQFIPERPATVGRGRFSFQVSNTQTNILVDSFKSDISGVVDMELNRTLFNLRYGVAPKTELSLQVPIMHTTSGFLDSFIVSFEESVGAKREIRKRYPDFAFDFTFARDDQEFLRSERNETGIGDIVLEVKREIFPETTDWPAFSLRAGVKFPTGDEDIAFGSGEADVGLGFVVEKKWMWFTFYGSADVVFPGRILEEVGIDFRETYAALIGAEYHILPRLSFLLQMDWLTKPFARTGNEILDRRVLEFTAAFAYAIKDRYSFMFGVIEDAFSSDGAGGDVSFFLNLAANF